MRDWLNWKRQGEEEGLKGLRRSQLRIQQTDKCGKWSQVRIQDTIIVYKNTVDWLLPVRRKQHSLCEWQNFLPNKKPSNNLVKEVTRKQVTKRKKKETKKQRKKDYLSLATKASERLTVSMNFTDFTILP